MGTPTGRTPGPLGQKTSSPITKLLGIMRDLITTVDLRKTLDLAFDMSHLRSEALRIVGQIYHFGGAVPADNEGGSFRDPTPANLPGVREGDAQRFVKTPGVRLTTLGYSLKLRDIRLSPDSDMVNLLGSATATLEIPTPDPAFDTPTEIPIYIKALSLGTTDITAQGYARAYQIVKAQYKLSLHFDSALLLKKLVQLAKQNDVHRQDVEEMLQHMSFDLSTVLKAGPIPLSLIKMSARSLLPLKHPLIGATDDLIPVQIAALPDHDLLIGGLQLIPKGVFFNVNAPGPGFHYSSYRSDHGFSGTLAGLVLPNLSDLSDPNLFAYLDVSYSKRVSESLDIKIDLTYSFSPSTATAAPDPLQLQYLHAESKSWLPTSEENLPPDQNLSGNNVMITVKGVFNAL
jgi:hypothetical protein